VYVIGSLAAFDRLRHTTVTLAWGDNVFRTVWAVLYSIGFDTKPVPLLQPYIKTPVLTNVYTVYQPYFLDFSYVGAVLIQFFLGLLHGHIYRRAVRGSAFFVALYGLSLYPLVMQFFQDQYLNLLSTWVQFAAVFGMFVWICRPRTLVAENALPSMIAVQGD
jgi:oligosaccharide repeat unit polymerase